MPFSPPTNVRGHVSFELTEYLSQNMVLRIKSLVNRQGFVGRSSEGRDGNCFLNEGRWGKKKSRFDSRDTISPPAFLAESS
jgi:hypothetical protein